MDRQATLLDDLYTVETDDLVWPCARTLKAGEAVASAVITCVRDHGAADADAAAVVSTPYQVVGTDVVQRLSGMKAGVWYRITGVITLTSGRKLAGVGIVYAKAP